MVVFWWSKSNERWLERQMLCKLISNANQELKYIDYQYSTHFGVVNIVLNANPELRTGLLLLMSFGHFVIPKGIKQQ